jgi:transcriptional regulator with GAF, ATPase, and Fis domain
LKNDALPEGSEPGIIGKSEAILYAIQKAKQVATTNAAVLLEGETGVGKELFANLIHKNSYRSDKPLVKVNCAALPSELIESELFGHEKGSFTGALQARKGRFELANGGTIFLDEIGELPLSLQPKLLRVLQNGEFERIGSQETIKVDVRIISATNRNLLSEVNTNHFREDLYYRLNVFPVTIPALRNRKEDIPLLVNHFVKTFSDEHHKQIENISKADLVRLTEYPWPGNIRELINVIERSIISSKGNTLRLEWIDSFTETTVSSFSIEEVERAHILKVLKESNWKINGQDGAAVKLGLNPNTLRSRLKKLNISRSDN